MKRMPSGLITFLAATPNVHKADLFAISLPTGTVMYATEGQWDITVPSGTPGWSLGTTTFKAAAYGSWKRGKITSEAGRLAAGTMSLTCLPQVNTAYPNLPITLLSAALNHLFDGAKVQVWTAYMPIGQYGTVSAGIETKWMGTITKAPRIARNMVEFECADPFYLLNLKVPTRLMQANCPWAFCDANCGLTAGDYTQTFTAAGGSNQRQLTPVSAFSEAAGYFSQGVVTCLTGANAGLSQSVKVHAGGVLQTAAPWVLPVQAGDTFSVIKGCDKTLATCKAVKKTSGAIVDNSIHFGGTPFVPAPSTAI